jgi:hypothetical protein
MWRYLTVLYIDRRGLNIRNDLAHGLLEMNMFNRAVADRVFHSLLVIALVRAVTKPDLEIPTRKTAKSGDSGAVSA